MGFNSGFKGLIKRPRKATQALVMMAGLVT